MTNIPTNHNSEFWGTRIGANGKKLEIYSLVWDIEVRFWPNISVWARVKGDSRWQKRDPRDIGISWPGLARLHACYQRNGHRVERMPEFFRNLYSFYLSIPSLVRQRVTEFPANDQLFFLALENDYPLLAQDLHDSNPQLLYLLSQHQVLRKWKRPANWIHIGKVLKLKQKDILEFLGLPASNALLKAMKKVPFSNQCADTTDTFLNYHNLSNNQKQLISHATYLPKPLLELITDPELESLITPSLIKDLSYRRYSNRAQTGLLLVQELVKMCNYLQTPHPLRIKSCKQLLKIHEDLSRDYIQLKYANNPKRPPFPSEPVTLPTQLPTGLQVEPILSGEDVIMEGRKMQHCAAGLLDDVLKGKSFLYRLMHNGERCTCEIRPNGKSQWEVTQCRKKRNDQPSISTLRAVSELFSRIEGIDDAKRFAALELLFEDAA